jgi:hypothetical protein
MKMYLGVDTDVAGGVSARPDSLDAEGLRTDSSITVTTLHRQAFSP